MAAANFSMAILSVQEGMLTALLQIIASDAIELLFRLAQQPHSYLKHPATKPAPTYFPSINTTLFPTLVTVTDGVLNKCIVSDSFGETLVPYRGDGFVDDIPSAEEADYFISAYLYASSLPFPWLPDQTTYFAVPLVHRTIKQTTHDVDVIVQEDETPNLLFVALEFVLRSNWLITGGS
ncbi:hypothetical protein K503DRAFT_805143 [Rhizopogon vinicolor AM-OR11-026]|uniref:Uncharacterized protein n=1 Tax=Rhizopogon vinicolor AM-OR11-026 TaxID=1314800 RepID=A0A1B7MIW8_9AGAM|nr:hypothetical protein K503DRAFT_805143 [Rhizopogon vinicolor AM-OR11-026]